MPTVRYTVAQGEVIAEKRGGTRSLYVPDPLGSTLALIDNTQTITDSWVYWPYGEAKTRTGTTATPFQYVGTQGYYHDSDGRGYVRARYLDKAKARWLTEDPLTQSPAEPNLYVYASCSPLVFTDREGLQSTLARGIGEFWACFNRHLEGGKSRTDACRACASLLPPSSSLNCGNPWFSPPANPAPPPPGRGWIDCFGNCIAAGDPIGVPGLVGFTCAGGTFPKPWVGVKPLPGAKPVTSVPGACQVGLRKFCGIRVGWLRPIGRFFSPIWIGYGLYLGGREAWCAGACLADYNAF